MGRWILVCSVPLLWVTAALILWPGPFDLFLDPFTLGALTFLVAGMILIFKVPDNPIGWMVMAYSFLTSAGLVPDALAVVWGTGIRANWADTIGVALATAAIMPLALAMLHFPDGKLPSRRWLPANWSVALGAAVGVGASIFNGGWGGDPGVESPDSPLRATTSPIGDVLSSVFFLLLPLSFVLAGAALVRRFVGAGPTERRQILLIALAGGVVVLAITTLTIMGVASADTGVGAVVLGSSLAAWPAALTLAVLRYRLYEIDRIISRTLSYGIVTTLLVGIYLGAVFVLGTVLALEGELAVAGSTLLSAAVFNPLRKRIQRVVDRRFNRSRFDAELLLQAFSKRLSTEVDLPELGRALEILARQTVQPASVTVWVREQGG